jgi:hypothetical protein
VSVTAEGDTLQLEQQELETSLVEDNPNFASTPEDSNNAGTNSGNQPRSSGAAGGMRVDMLGREEAQSSGK